MMLSIVNVIIHPRRRWNNRFLCGIVGAVMIAVSIFQPKIVPQYNEGTTENIRVIGIDQNGAGYYSMEFETGEYYGCYFIDSEWYCVKGCVNNPELLNAYKNLDYNKLKERFSLVDFIFVTRSIAFPVDDAEGLLKETLENM